MSILDMYLIGICVKLQNEVKEFLLQININRKQHKLLFIK